VGDLSARTAGMQRINTFQDLIKKAGGSTAGFSQVITKSEAVLSIDESKAMAEGFGKPGFKWPPMIDYIVEATGGKLNPFVAANMVLKANGQDPIEEPSLVKDIGEIDPHLQQIVWSPVTGANAKLRAVVQGSGHGNDVYLDRSRMRSSFREDAPIPAGNQSAAWSALGATIAWAEGGQYNNMFGNATFTDFSRHPDRVQSAGGHRSAAAGRYQFMPGTYAELQQAYPELSDFSPENQERAGEILAKRRGVDTTQFIETKEEFIQIMHLMSPEWAALPNQDTGGSYYTDQQARKIDDLWQYYQARVKQFRRN